MKNYRIIALVLAFIMMFSAMTFSQELSEQDIASKLYSIGLVSGDGSGLNLNGELTRAEAATFIVKLIGREKTVLNSPSFYGMTPFSDIKGDEWYAPFVGFCSMNQIISGYPDNTFRANEKLTEKAFLSMVLKALKYSGEDFNWENVFLTAYNKGIVTDLSYAVKEEDSNLDRGETLAIMYNSLNLYYKDNSMTLLDNLVKEGVVTDSKAESLGLVKKDEKKTSIVKAEAVLANQIQVTLNESIKGMTVNQIALSNGSTNYMVKDVSLKDKLLTIDVDANLIGDDFVITFVNVVDNDDFVVQSISKEVESFEAPEVNSDYFKIKTVECESENILHVFFTQPVNMNAALVLHYEVLQNGQTIATGTYNDMEAAVLGEVDNGIALYIKSVDFKDNELYTLKVYGSLTSAYDANLNEGEAMTIDFIGDDSSNKSLKVTNIEAISKDTVRVIFNQDIDKSIALNITNYQFRNESHNSNSAVLSASMNETGDLKNRTLDLRVLDMSNNLEYELTILNVRDAFKMSTISNKSYSLEGQSYSNTSSKIVLEYVQIVSSSKLYLYFEEAIHPASVAANITGVDDVLVTYSDKYKNRLVVYLDKDETLIDNKSYTVLVNSGLIAADGKTQSYPTSYSIKGDDKQEPNIDVEDARFIAGNKVKITFNSEVAVSNMASQYKLQYQNDLGHDVSITADSVNYVNASEVVASFSNLPNETYELVLYNIVDPSNQFTTQLIETKVEKE